MTEKTILDVLNSAPTFGILFAIAVGVWLLIMKRETRSKSKK